MADVTYETTAAWTKRTALERTEGKLLESLNQFNSRETSLLFADAAPNNETIHRKQRAKWASIDDDDHNASITRKQKPSKSVVR